MKLTRISLKASAAALAMSLAATSVPAFAEAHEDASTAEAEATTQFPLTPQGAADFVASVEAEYAEFSVTFGHVSWLQSTNINHDSNTLASQYGAELTLMGVRFATEAVWHKLAKNERRAY